MHLPRKKDIQVDIPSIVYNHISIRRILQRAVRALAIMSLAVPPYLSSLQNNIRARPVRTMRKAARRYC